MQKHFKLITNSKYFWHISYFAASLLVVLTTIGLFFTKKTTFDLVGQQVLAHQWLHGEHTLSMVGQTHYLFKILFLYMPLDISGGDRRQLLIASTVLINVISFVLICLLIQKIAIQFGVSIGKRYALAVLWFATVFGSVFWAQFSNSRNIEIVGGALLIYLVLRYLSAPSNKLLAILSGLSVVLFFSDMLQFYMTALPLIIYAVVMGMRDIYPRKLLAALVAVLVGCFVVAKLLLQVVASYTFINFANFGATAMPPINVQTTIDLAVNIVRQYSTLYAGQYVSIRAVWAANILFVVGLVVIFIAHIIRTRHISRLAIFAFIFLAANKFVYWASGQAYLPGTSRYLIMTSLIFLLIFAAVLHSTHKQKIYMYVAIGVICLNALALVGIFGQSVQNRFSSDTALSVVEEYAKDQRYDAVFTSMDTAIPISYYSNFSTRVLPLSCADNILQKTSMFFDKKAYLLPEQKDGLSAIVFDSSSISNYPHVCTPETTFAQFGQPQSQNKLSNGSLVLIYRTGVVENSLTNK